MTSTVLCPMSGQPVMGGGHEANGFYNCPLCGTRRMVTDRPEGLVWADHVATTGAERMGPDDPNAPVDRRPAVITSPERAAMDVSMAAVIECMEDAARHPADAAVLVAEAQAHATVALAWATLEGAHITARRFR